jgi:hypothetical protein
MGGSFFRGASGFASQPCARIASEGFAVIRASSALSLSAIFRIMPDRQALT